MSIFDILNPVKALVDAANSVIGRFVADPKQKAAAQLALFQAQASLQEAAMAAQQQLADAQSKIIVAEAQSESWIARNWRPIAMLTFLAIIVYQGPLVSIFHWPPVSYASIPDRMWSLLELGIGGYIGGRTLEKVVPVVARALKP